MIVKFNKPLCDYKYILSFDLAKQLSGYALIDIVNNKVITTGMINMHDSESECIWHDYSTKVAAVIKKCQNLLPESERISMLITKEKLPLQGGKFSSIETLQALAQCHAIFDTIVCGLKASCYDYEGIHSVSVKSYFKHLTGIQQPTKEDIANKIKTLFPDYDFSKDSLDVTDAIGVAITLVDYKWNVDIDAKIKELKREKKTYKSSKKIIEIDTEIDRLIKLKKEELTL